MGPLHVISTSTAAITARNAGGGSAIVGKANSGSLLRLFSIAPDTLRFVVANNGDVCADGSITQNGGCDLAENMAVRGRIDRYQSGDVLVLSETDIGWLEHSREIYSRRVAGIISTQPGYHLGANAFGHEANQVPVALSGIVPCRVSTENGPIEVGDLLVTSSAPGVAMRATDPARAFGAVIGKAMEPLSEGESRIQVLVGLQ